MDEEKKEYYLNSSLVNMFEEFERCILDNIKRRLDIHNTDYISPAHSYTNNPANDFAQKLELLISDRINNALNQRMRDFQMEMGFLEQRVYELIEENEDLKMQLPVISPYMPTPVSNGTGSTTYTISGTTDADIKYKDIIFTNIYK